MAFLRGNYLGIICLVVAVGLAVSGTVSVVRGLAQQRSVAETRSLGEIPDATKSASQQTGRFMQFAQPVTISAPSVGIESPLVTVGKTATGSIDTPQGVDFDKAAWYRDSPAPGQYGASVIVGHVDSYQNDNAASVFYSLSKLKPGDTVNITRADKTTAVFEVYALREYGRQSVPANQVYSAHTNNAELRLITCSGSFDTKSGEYSDNTVVFASLISSRPSS